MTEKSRTALRELMAKAQEAGDLKVASRHSRAARRFPRAARSEGRETLASLPLWEGMVVMATMSPDGEWLTFQAQYGAEDAEQLLASMAGSITRHITPTSDELGWEDAERWEGASELLFTVGQPTEKKPARRF